MRMRKKILLLSGNYSWNIPDSAAVSYKQSQCELGLLVRLLSLESNDRTLRVLTNDYTVIKFSGVTTTDFPFTTIANSLSPTIENAVSL